MDAGKHGQNSNVFPVRGLCCCTCSLMPRRSCEQPAVPDQVTVSRLISSDWAAHDLAYGPCSNTSSTAPEFSTAWRKRNQEAGGMRCAVSGGVLPRSITTI